MKSTFAFKHIISFILLFNLTTFKLVGQDTLTALYAEENSFQLYQDKKWKELIKFGNKALDKGYNYFYMQMRVGVAYFENKQYGLAEPHFRKALSFNSDDELAQEYLYYCYLYVGRTEDARMLSKHFSKKLLIKIGSNKIAGVGFITFEGGTKLTDSTSYYNTYTKSSSTYFHPATYFQLGLEHGIAKRISLFHATTYFSQQTFVGSLKQLQYYLRAAVPIKNGWLISPSFHLVNIDFSSQTTTYITDTLWPPGMPHIQPPPGAPPLKTETKSSTSTKSDNSSYYIESISIQKIIKGTTLSVGSTFSNMLHVNQYINSAALYYSVLGNSKIVIGCTGYLHTTDNYKTTYASAIPFIYVQPAKSVSLKLSYLYNRGNNIIEDNGYFINNSPDLTKARVGALANFSITNSVSLYALYQLEFKRENFQQFDYRYNVLVAGIKITPTRKN